MAKPETTSVKLLKITVKHDGKTFGPGDTAKLPTNLADALIASGDAEASTSEKTGTPTETQG